MIEGGIPARVLLATDGSGDAAQAGQGHPLARARRRKESAAAGDRGDRQTWNYRYPGRPVERNPREES